MTAEERNRTGRAPPIYSLECVFQKHISGWGSFGGRLGVGGGSLPFDMPASEAASATYQRAHWPRLYGALVSCGTVFAEVDAKIEDLWANFRWELSLYQRTYLRNVATSWCNVIQHALKYNLRVSHGYLVRGLKIIDAINSIYASIEARRRQHDVKHRHLCICSLCYVESEYTWLPPLQE